MFIKFSCSIIHHINLRLDHLISVSSFDGKSSPKIFDNVPRTVKVFEFIKRWRRGRGVKFRMIAITMLL